MNGNNMHNQPIRRYRRQKGYDSARTVAVLVMTAIILIGIVVFIMSLTGTGLFADRKNPDDLETPVGSDGTDDSSDEESSTEPSETDPPIKVPEGEVTYQYLSLTPADIKKGDLLLIDATHPYTFPDVKMTTVYGNKSQSYKVKNATLSLRLSVINEINKMMDAFVSATGFYDAMVSSAYRSFNDQQSLYDKNPTTAAIPGCSDYHTGSSFMFEGYNETGIFPMSNRSESIWLKENAHHYGFTFRYPTDKQSITGYSVPWQMRYVGIPHATYMYDKFLCMEEYVALLAEKHKYADEHLLVECADGFIYEIFYVQGATEGVIQVPVPENRDYTLSGDNQNGFIVSFAVCESTAAQQ